MGAGAGNLHNTTIAIWYYNTFTGSKQKMGGGDMLPQITARCTCGRNKLQENTSGNIVVSVHASKYGIKEKPH